jgi:hypothetical protein
VWLEGLGKLKKKINSPNRVSNSRPSGLLHIILCLFVYSSILAKQRLGKKNYFDNEYTQREKNCWNSRFLWGPSCIEESRRLVLPRISRFSFFYHLMAFSVLRSDSIAWDSNTTDKLEGFGSEGSWTNSVASPRSFMKGLSKATETSVKITNVSVEQVCVKYLANTSSNLYLWTHLSSAFVHWHNYRAKSELH